MGCSKRVRATLTSLDGVENVNVDFKTKTASLKMKDGSTLCEESMAKALKAQGYGGVVKGA